MFSRSVLIGKLLRAFPAESAEAITRKYLTNCIFVHFVSELVMNFAARPLNGLRLSRILSSDWLSHRALFRNIKR